jgi:hypothetical protein
MAHADPGGIFASDNHRRVLAHIPTPDAGYGVEFEPLLARLGADEHTTIDFDDVQGILGDLEADGDVKSYKGDVYRQTQKGFDALTGPNAEESPESPNGEADLGKLKTTPIGG